MARGPMVLMQWNNLFVVIKTELESTACAPMATKKTEKMSASALGLKGLEVREESRGST